MMIYLMRIHYNGCVYITSNPDTEITIIGTTGPRTLRQETAEVLKYREGTEEDMYLLKTLFQLVYLEEGSRVFDYGLEARLYYGQRKVIDSFMTDFNCLRENLLGLSSAPFPLFWSTLKRPERIRLYHILHKEV